MSAVLSALSFDGTAFTEHLNDGSQFVYQNQVAGGDPVVHPLIRVPDASYGPGRLSYRIAICTLVWVSTSQRCLTKCLPAAARWSSAQPGELRPTADWDMRDWRPGHRSLDGLGPWQN